MANNYLNQLQTLIRNHAQGYAIKVYLFGSRAKQTARQRSDIDIAILPLQPLPATFLSDLKEQIEESTIPYSVDLVDLSQVDVEFRNKILSEAIEWKD